MFPVGKKTSLPSRKHIIHISITTVVHCSIFSLNMKYRGLDTKVAVLKQCSENIKALGPDHMDTRMSFQPPNTQA